MAKTPAYRPAVSPGPDQQVKTLEAFRSFAVGFEKDLLVAGAREVALILGSARQAAEEILATAEGKDPS